MLYVDLALLVLGLIFGFLIGLYVESKKRRVKPSGTLVIVEWEDGTEEMLLQLDEEPKNLSNRSIVTFALKKSRR